jgi:transposase, IS5 family
MVMKQAGFFDIENRYAALSEAGDPLEKLLHVVDFEVFRKSLDKALKYSDRRKGGRPPFDTVLMFKIMVLQALYSLSDDQTEFLCRDRLSFMRFLGLSLSDTVPDAKTIWLFRERLSEKGIIDKLFNRFDSYLHDKGLLALGGQIMDATIVEAPKQRNNEDEKNDIKNGKTPKEWQDKPHKIAQKDIDARWTLKRGRKKDSQSQLMVPAYGYKNHIGTDRHFGLIRTWEVTSASANDGKVLLKLLDDKNCSSKVWADTAYRSKDNEKGLDSKGFKSLIHFRRAPNKDLTYQQKKANAACSKVRSKVEHVFAEQKSRMGLFIRTIGIKRAKVKIGMANLAFNMRRFVFLETRTRQTAPA